MIDDRRPSGAWCAVIRANGQDVAITPDGTIYSCALFIGRDEKYETDHVAKPERGGLDTSLKQFDYPDECKKHPYLPICANYRAKALSQKARYDLTLPKVIKAHYDL